VTSPTLIHRTAGAHGARSPQLSLDKAAGEGRQESPARREVHRWHSCGCRGSGPVPPSPRRAVRRRAGDLRPVSPDLSGTDSFLPRVSRCIGSSHFGGVPASTAGDYAARRVAVCNMVRLS